MRCPVLNELPPPPVEKIGWPWTEQSKLLDDRMDDGSEWPRISIVTPSYNYGQFVEETIRSVLLQGYPNLEYIIIDGGSTDNTVEVIQKYEKYLTYWVSEPDQGQTDAINKGYQKATGQIFVWLNADDTYIDPTCLKRVSELYKQGNELIVGRCFNVDGDDKPLQLSHEFNGYSKPQSFEEYLKFWSFIPLPQPAVFIAKRLTDLAFPLDTNLHNLMDYQLFLKALSCQPKSIWCDHNWVKFRYHGSNKSLHFDEKIYLELHQIASAQAKESLNYLQNILFQVRSKDYVILSLELNDKQEPDALRIFKALLLRPSLAGWVCFWKVLIKSLIGWKRYSNYLASKSRK